MAYIISRTLETKIAIAENNNQNTLLVTLDVLKEILALLKEQETEIEHMKRPDCEHAEHDGIGCLGYCGCTQDDEPIEACKRCEKYTGNVYEALSVKTKETDGEVNDSD